MSSVLAWTEIIFVEIIPSMVKERHEWEYILVGCNSRSNILVLKAVFQDIAHQSLLELAFALCWWLFINPG